MNQNIVANIEKYLELFEHVRQKVGDDIVARAVMQEVAKDVRMEQIREEREVHPEPATQRQLQFMKRLGVDIPAGVSKTEASRLIDQELGRNGED